MRRFLLLALLGLLVSASTVSAASGDNFLTTDLSAGDEGEEVTLLQTWLAEDTKLYPEGVVNGIFGPATERAVKRFQQQMGIISADPSGTGRYGKVGPVTRAGLNAKFSDIQGGTASVEGAYDSMMKFEEGNFVPLTEKTYDLNVEALATFEAWVNPMTNITRDTPVLENGEGYGIGLAEGRRLYATSPKGKGMSTKSPVRAGEWQHISALFTETDAVLLYNNQLLEIVPLVKEKDTSFLGNIFHKLADAFGAIFPVAEYTAPAPSVEPVVQNDTGVIGSLVSFARGIFGLPPVPESITVTEIEPPLGTTPVIKPIPAPAVVASPKPASTPAIVLPPIFTPEAGTTTSTSSLAEATTTPLVTASTTATSTAVVATTTKTKSRGKTPKDSTPLITLVGSKNVSVAPGAVYTDPGATAYDLEEGDLTSQIVVGGDTIDYDNAGTYHITYNVTDASGAVAKEVIRNVSIMTIPELSPEEQEPQYSLAPAGQEISYSVSSGEGADPRFISIDISPLHVYVGDTQTFTVNVTSESGVESVTTSTELDTVTHEMALTKINDTTFEGSWEVYDTHVREYRTRFTARSGSGSENSMTMAWSDPCSGVTQGGDSTLGADCTVSSVYGLDGGTLTIPGGRTLTINSGGTWAFNPGTSISVSGVISKGAGGTIKKGYLFYQDCSGCVDTNTMYYFATTPQTGYSRTSTYSQGSYYSEGSYYTEPGYCFAPRTPVLMADGSYKNIEDIVLGDAVMGQTEAGILRPNIVTKLYHHVYTENAGVLFDTLRVNDSLVVTAEHPMMTTRGIVSAGDLVVGDLLLAATGTTIVETLEEGPSLPRVYNLSVYPDHTYFAGDVLVHNKGWHGLPP